MEYGLAFSYYVVAMWSPEPMVPTQEKLDVSIGLAAESFWNVPEVCKILSEPLLQSLFKSLTCHYCCYSVLTSDRHFTGKINDSAECTRTM